MSGTCDACEDPAPRLYLYEDGGSYCRDCYKRGGEPAKYPNGMSITVQPGDGVTIRDVDSGEVVEDTTGSAEDARRIALVGCGAEKADEPCAAKDLYTSNYASLKRGYGEECADEWAFLSAEHGILYPDEGVEPYDTTIGDLDADELEAWADDILAELDDWIAWDRSDGADWTTVDVLAGQPYLAPLRERLEERDRQQVDVSVRFPFDDTEGIGEQMQWLSQQIETTEEDQEDGR